MDVRIEENIKIKIAITLNKLLVSNKAKKQEDETEAKSYNQIALIADIRKATVSNVFNGKSIPNSVTLISIIEALGYGLQDFAVVYDSIKYSKIEKFKEERNLD